MKKGILIFCTVLITFSLTAFGYVKWSNTETDQAETSCSKKVAVDDESIKTTDNQSDIDMFYDVNSRFVHTITKEKLDRAKAIKDLVPNGVTEGLASFRDVKIGIVSEDEKYEKGRSDVLNSAQLNLLESTNYSTNFYIEAFCKRKNPDTGKMEDQCFVYYITIVPEKEASFKSGRLALINYLKDNSKGKTTVVHKDKLKPGKVSFTITKKGTIANVKLTSTSGYTSIDEGMVERVTGMPKWNPARNSKGELVDQELVFFFGIVGC